jgi:hypothetical protein
MTPAGPGLADVAASVTELQNLLLATSSVRDFLSEVAVLAARVVADGLSCGITLQQDGRPESLDG